MILSISFSIRLGFVLLAVLIGLAAGAGPNHAADDKASGAQSRLKIAVFPVFNLSATPAPLKYIRQQLIDILEADGEILIDDQRLEEAFAKHRIRYVGGLDPLAALAIEQETGADAVFITSLEHYSDVVPPKIALTARLVSTGNRIRILWMAGAGLAGDDSPGLLDLGMIENPDTLMRIAIQRIMTSFAEFRSTGRAPVDAAVPQGKHRPKVIFRSPVLDPAMSYAVAVMPFYNLSERKFAGDIMALHFVRQLLTNENWRVIEPGVVRQALLKGRVIMRDGISLADAGSISRLLAADMILSGKVMDYQDFQGMAAKPKVVFSAEIFEKNSREVVWAAQSHNRGDDGVFSQMVQLAVEEMIEPE
jgi:hypothetical protein